MSKINLKDISVDVFVALAYDEELNSLLEVPTKNMKDIKLQIIEDRYPNDLVDDNLSRLCVFENPSSDTFDPNVERGWFEVDIYVTKEKNKINRRTLLIAQRLVDLLDDDERKKRNLEPIGVGTGLLYFNRLPNMQTQDPEWTKYGLVFKYDYIKL